MDRTTAAGNVDIGAGRRGFRDQNQSAGVMGTVVNALHLNSVQEEIMAVIEDPTIDPPLVPDPNYWGQLLEAINRKIEAVRVLQPIFPEVLTTDGIFSITSPVAGTVRLGAGTEWIMRGGKKRISPLQDFLTSPSKIYHLRWVNGAFGLYDLASLTYNPTALAEDNPLLDTTYDDMLIARITTSAGNVPTITPLANRPFLDLVDIIAGTSVQLSGVNGANFLVNKTLNWARRPKIYTLDFAAFTVDDAQTDRDMNIMAVGVNRTDAFALNSAPTVVPVTRYELAAVVMCDAAESLKMQFFARA